MSNLPNPPKNPHPLWVISMFFIFTEVVLGIAVFNTQGTIQFALTCFVIAFPIANAIMFYWILITKPQNFYTPTDYSDDKSFLEVMKISKEQRLGQVAKRLEETIKQNMNSQSFIEKLTTSSDKNQLVSILNNEAQQLNKEIKKAAFITIDLSAFSEDLDPLVLPIDALPTIDDLTDEVYFSLEPRVRPYAYGHDWVLINTETEETIKVTRMISESPAGKPMTDNRTLEEMNIKPGAVLRALPILKNR